MDITIKDKSNLVEEMDKEYMLQDKQSFEDISKIMSFMGKVKKKELITTILESTSMAPRPMEHSNTATTSMKEDLMMISSKDKEHLIRPRVAILDLFTMDFNMDMENFSGKMEVSIEVITIEDLDKEMASFITDPAKVFAGEFGDMESWMEKEFIKSQEELQTVLFGRRVELRLYVDIVFVL